MSVRTRQNRQRKPGVASVARPGRYDRRLAHRRVRRAAVVGLHTMVEPDDLTLPRPVNSSVKTDPSERPERAVGQRRFKVWKTKEWKRRSASRAKRVEQYQAFLKGQ